MTLLLHVYVRDLKLVRIMSTAVVPVAFPTCASSASKGSLKAKANCIVRRDLPEARRAFSVKALGTGGNVHTVAKGEDEKQLREQGRPLLEGRLPPLVSTKEKVGPVGEISGGLIVDNDEDVAFAVEAAMASPGQGVGEVNTSEHYRRRSIAFWREGRKAVEDKKVSESRLNGRADRGGTSLEQLASESAVEAPAEVSKKAATEAGGDAVGERELRRADELAADVAVVAAKGQEEDKVAELNGDGDATPPAGNGSGTVVEASKAGDHGSLGEEPSQEFPPPPDGPEQGQPEGTGEPLPDAARNVERGVKDNLVEDKEKPPQSRTLPDEEAVQDSLVEDKGGVGAT